MNDTNRSVISPFSTLQLLYYNSYMSSGRIPPQTHTIELCQLWCLVEGEGEPFEIIANVEQNIYQLKKLIQGEKVALRSVDASHIALWKLVNVIDLKPAKTLSSRLPRLSSEFFVNMAEPGDTISSYFIQGIPRNCLHIVVGRSAESASTDKALPRVSRSDTVMALYQKLQSYQLIQVRGTPGTGKSSLCQLLAHYIAIHDSTTNVISIPMWTIKEVIARNDWKIQLKRRGWVEENKTLFIFDEAQVSYADADLWNNFFKSIHDYPHCRAIVFASYGSPTVRFKVQGTPIIIPDEQRVTLRAIQHKDNLPAAGLLFTRMEFDDLVSVMYPSPEYVFDISFFDSLFNLTEGHVGAIVDFIRIILADDSYREIRNVPDQSYTWTRFSQRVSLQTLLKNLSTSSVFARGLPPTLILQDPNFVAVFEAVLCAGVVTDADFTHAGETDAILQCFREGWLHTDQINGLDISGYRFPSRLHHWYVEWKLWGTMPSTPLSATNLLDFAVTVIRMFSPQVLATGRQVGPGFIQRPPEAQYQDEFYRCCHRYSKGSLITFPEYGTKCGRVDFYIPSKEWGIELLRDGNQLEQHSVRFSSAGAYGGTISLSDYIILDFRANSPKKPHSHIRKLYHVVFSDNFHTVRILDNDLKEVSGGHFTLLSSS